MHTENLESYFFLSWILKKKKTNKQPQDIIWLLPEKVLAICGSEVSNQIRTRKNTTHILWCQYWNQIEIVKPAKQGGICIQVHLCPSLNKLSWFFLPI